MTPLMCEWFKDHTSVFCKFYCIVFFIFLLSIFEFMLYRFMLVDVFIDRVFLGFFLFFLSFQCAIGFHSFSYITEKN